jgi:translation initiation factor IF-2
MFDDLGNPIKQVGPSLPAVVLGLNGTPDAGDEMIVLTDERKAREVAQFRESRQRETKLATQQGARLDLFAQMGEGGQAVRELYLMLKTDVQGSAEALGEALTKLSTDEVKVKIVSTGVGGISESDVDLALASKAIIIGFNVRADSVARKAIQEGSLDVRYYSIIYDVINDVKAAMSGLLGTETREQMVGLAEVRDVFRSSQFGNIAGCLVVEGQVRRGLPIRVLRDNVVIYEGELESLRRHKDDVSKVEAGTECGIGVKNYNDVKAGDQIEVFERIEVKRTVA